MKLVVEFVSPKIRIVLPRILPLYLNLQTFLDLFVLLWLMSLILCPEKRFNCKLFRFIINSFICISFSFLSQKNKFISIDKKNLFFQLFLDIKIEFSLSPRLKNILIYQKKNYQVKKMLILLLPKFSVCKIN